MARFHVHVAVGDLQESIRFYSTLFGQAPLLMRDDYAKWHLANPALNFAISTRGHTPGVNHLGFQAETPAEFDRMRQLASDIDQANKTIEAEAECCYARSEKYWIMDPQGLAWEHFQTLDGIPVFGVDEQQSALSNGGCCAPLKKSSGATAAACCVPSATASSRSHCC